MLDKSLRAIAGPRRRDILKLIQGTEMTSGTIATHFSVTRPAISQHLMVLADAGLVALRKEGTRRFYQTRPEGLSDLRAYLESFWTDWLLDYKLAVESERREDRKDD